VAQTVSSGEESRAEQYSHARPRLQNPAFPLSGYLTTALLSVTAVFITEWVSRSNAGEALKFFAATDQPAWLAVGIVFIMLLAIDALIGREHKAILIVLPVLLFGALINQQKQHYLTDPFYPSDILFTRQIMDLMPVLAKERPGMAAGLALGVIAVLALVAWSWIFAWKRFPRLSLRQRSLRLLVALPLVAGFAHMMDYNKFFWIRDRFQAIPMMWDQKENYAHNGFILAYMFNVPMAEISAPAGYMRNAIGNIQLNPLLPVSTRAKPDVIVIMSESFWDPTRLPAVQFAEDPMPTVRALQGGNMFSPEFGGLTANIEFEAITGLSNAFLPAGSVPYQQYIREPLPSMATFLRGEGYSTRAIHPYQNWFWNRSAVYKALGFESFRSEENMPVMPKHGNFATDDALMKEVVRQGDDAETPFFFYTVTLQGHGPYEPNRYDRNTVKFTAEGMPDEDRAELETYVEGVKQADASLKMLVDWAKQRERETIIVFFGDHLPPLGHAYISGGYMNVVTATRRAPLAQMKREHETPLIIWSSKSGPVKDIGTISPALIPYRISKLAGLEHPYYTGFLGRVADNYKIVDRYMLEKADGTPNPDWPRQKTIDPLIKDYRFLQHDLMFGQRYGLERFFPEYSQIVDSGT
jgi:phosphoglycerol transferase MdoB-like AlkP superfamily enzyme